MIYKDILGYLGIILHTTYELTEKKRIS